MGSKSYTQLKLAKTGHVGIITISHPPRNGFSKCMVSEMLRALDEYEADKSVRVVMVNGEGPDFSKGADFSDLTDEISEKSGEATFSDLGGRLVQRIECYPKATLVAARGECWGGSSAIFSAFDIRIVGEGFSIHDGDIYYGTVGSWGMSSLRLPIWIGRNKIMDYMFLNEGFTARQAYELGLVSKVVPDELVDTIGLEIAAKMAKAAPIAVRYFKECVRKAIYSDFQAAREFEVQASEIVFATEDCKNGLLTLMEKEGSPMCEFYGR